MKHLTTAQLWMLQALRTEAAIAGDTEQVDLCDRATTGDPSALAECWRVIKEAKAQEDTL